MTTPLTRKAWDLSELGRILSLHQMTLGDMRAMAEACEARGWHETSTFWRERMAERQRMESCDA